MALPQQEMLKNYRARLQALARGINPIGMEAAGAKQNSPADFAREAAGEKIQVTPYAWGSGPAPTFPKAAAESAQAAKPVPQAGQGVSAQEAKTVSQARDYLQGVIGGGGSGGYRSDYTGQIADLYDRIMNRPKFSYDPNKDPLYQNYRDQYMRNGQLAMRDAMGTAAGLTGGYGNSWGDTAGFQAYQAYLQQLGGVIPQLEQRAYERYQGEGADMLQRLALAQEMEAADISRNAASSGGQDALNAYLALLEADSAAQAAAEQPGSGVMDKTIASANKSLSEAMKKIMNKDTRQTGSGTVQSQASQQTAAGVNAGTAARTAPAAATGAAVGLPTQTPKMNAIQSAAMEAARKKVAVDQIVAMFGK